MTIHNPKDLLAAIKFASVAQSKEETRKYLNGVFFDKQPNKPLRLVATDGHRLHAIYTGLSDASEYKKLISTKDIKTLMTLLTISKDDFNLLEHLDKLTEIDGRFPEYNRVIPTLNDTTTIGHYRARHLSDTFKAFADLYKNDKSVTCTIQANDAMEAALVTVPDHDEAIAVIMPMRP